MSVCQPVFLVTSRLHIAPWVLCAGAQHNKQTNKQKTLILKF